MNPVTVERVVDCKSDAKSLWGVVSDTERMNREIGLEPVDFTPLAGAGAARFFGSTALGGFRVGYEERPFEWLEPSRLSVERVFRGGPLERLRFALSLEPTPDGGTRAHLATTLAPRLGLLAPLARLLGGRALDRMTAELRRIDFALKARGRAPASVTPATVDEDALARHATALRARAAPELVDELVTLLTHASDLEVARLRPFALADRWGADRRQVLAMLLQAVKEGLVDLRWDVVCPSCRTAISQVPTLAELREHATCQLCELDVEVSLEDAVELTFVPAPAIRIVDVGPYCIGGPARVPHVTCQAILPARGAVTLEAPDEVGTGLRLFLRGGAARAIFIRPGAPERVHLTTSELAEAPAVELAPRGTLELSNDTSEERHAKLERTERTDLAATVRELTTLPEFRREFSSDLLVPGMTLEVSRVALLFSDLTDSTRLYSDLGDAAAFRLVQDHFEVLFEVLERAGGAIVKTIGDSVMAAFADEIAATRAGVELLRAFERFRASSELRGRVRLKLGVHAGPTYVITANGALD